ncbi:hypothetical protein [Arsenicicoccus piscis]|uniref:hypothetical protein n=1 Tax=Arsenicicoccus piscis TaxID=673954 RepID=UPI003B9850D3
MDKLVRAFDLQQPLRERIAAGMPVYGSCAGLILLADRLGGRSTCAQQTLGGLDVLVRRNAFGRQVDSFEADLRDWQGARRAGARRFDHGAPWVRAGWARQVEVLASRRDSHPTGTPDADRRPSGRAAPRC